MSALSDYLENALLDHLRGGTAYTQPAGLHLALFSAAPNDAGGGTELSLNGYAREAVTFGAVVGGSMANTGDVVFTAAGGDWTAATHAAVFDAATGGNMLWHGALGATYTVLNGQTLTFSAGQITMALD